MERGPNTTTTTLQAMPTPIAPAGMVYVLAASIQAMAQRQACTESQLTQLLQQIWPWVYLAIPEGEAHIQAFTVDVIQERLTPIDSYIAAFERLVNRAPAQHDLQT